MAEDIELSFWKANKIIIRSINDTLLLEESFITLSMLNQGK
jgi:hypothetical protein